MSLKSLPKYRRKQLKALALAALILNLSWIASAYNITIPEPVSEASLDSPTLERAVASRENKGFGFTVSASAPRQSLNLILKQKLKHPYHVFQLAFSPDGEQLAAGGHLDRTVRVWDSRRGKLIREFTDQAGGVDALAYSPDGRYLAVGRGFVNSIKDNIAINIWDAKTGVLVHNIRAPFPTVKGSSNSVASLAYSPDGHLLAFANDDEKNSIVLRDLNSGNEIKARRGPGAIQKLAFSPSGKDIAIGIINGTIEMGGKQWDVA